MGKRIVSFPWGALNDELKKELELDVVAVVQRSEVT